MSAVAARLQVRVDSFYDTEESPKSSRDDIASVDIRPRDDASLDARRHREAHIPLKVTTDQRGHQDAQLSPASPAMTKSYESHSQYSASLDGPSYESDTLEQSGVSSHGEVTHDTSINADNVPVRSSSRRSARSKPEDESINNRQSNLVEGPDGTTFLMADVKNVSETAQQRRALPDGTLIPKLPPVPDTDALTKPRKAKSRRNRSPVLSFDGAVAEEELKLSQWQVLPDDPRRISTLGPKVTRNAPAPWELGGDEPDLPELPRLHVDSHDRPFARFKSRPSVDSHTSKSSTQSGLPFGMSARHTPKVKALEVEADKENDGHSLFAQQRSRSKSVSNSAVGMLKGLGLAAAASAPAAAKAKFSKALRLGAGHDEVRSSAPLRNVSANYEGMPAPAFSRYDDTNLPKSNSSRTITAMPPSSPSELAELLMFANNKYKDQACTPPISSLSNGRFASAQTAVHRTTVSDRRSIYSEESLAESDELQHSSSKDSNMSRATTRPSDGDDGSNSDLGDVAKGEQEGTPITHAPAMSLSPSSESSHLRTTPLGNIEGVQYKLISLEEAREQARIKKSEWLATTGAGMQPSTSTMSNDAFSEDAFGFRDGAPRAKKSGFLRKLKKRDGHNGDLDVSIIEHSSPSSKPSDLAQQPSFSVTEVDEKPRAVTNLGATSPSLSIRPVSSMFSGFTADFLDASTMSSSNLRDSSFSTTGSTSGLLVPHSPSASSFRSPDLSRTPSPLGLDAGRFASPQGFRSVQAKASSHESITGPTRSADSTSNHDRSESGSTRVKAGPDTGDTASDGHTSIRSPTTASFQHTVSSHEDATSDAETSEEVPVMSEEVQQHARSLEAQIRALCDELRELRVQHLGHGSAPLMAEVSAESRVGSCPSCGCGCAEQRHLESINEAALLTGASMLDRGRALKSSKHMVTTGRFGGYLNR